MTDLAKSNSARRFLGMRNTAPLTDAKAGSQIETAVATVSPNSKIARIIALMQRKDGATLPEMIEVTGWQPHTTRAALTGLRKKGHPIAKESRDNATYYRIAAEA